MQRPLPDNTQQSQETDVHVPGGIRSHNPEKGVISQPRFRLRGHWDQPANFTAPTLRFIRCLGQKILESPY